MKVLVSVNSSGTKRGVENDPLGFSSVVFARRMILKRNLGQSNFNYFLV